jgi:hypothetical protein
MNEVAVADRDVVAMAEQWLSDFGRELLNS